MRLVTLPQMGLGMKPLPIICAVDGPYLIICMENGYPIICRKFK